MSQRRDANDTLPIACTLTPAELATMRGGLLPRLVGKAIVAERIPGGLRWRFEPVVDLVREVAAVIETERRCCRFLRFLLLVEPGEAAVWLEATGPEGTEDFLSALLESR